MVPSASTTMVHAAEPLEVLWGDVVEEADPVAALYRSREGAKLASRLRCFPFLSPGVVVLGRHPMEMA